MGDRIAVLRAGSCQQLGTPDEIYHQPANTFVAGFVGTPSMNLLAGEIVRTQRDGHEASAVAVRLDNAAGIFLLSATLAAQALAASARWVVLGIRPEDVHVTPESEAGTLPATVYAVEPLGDRFIYDLQLGGAVIKVKAPASYNLAAGQPVRVVFDPQHAHLFDATTQGRIRGAAHG
jgi:multiple sugar transport system ATP-binding protein